MIRRLAITVPLLAALTLPAFAQLPPQRQLRLAGEDLGQLDSSEALFTVMAALLAGDYYPEAASPTNHPLRKAVADHLAQLKLPAVDALRRYVRDHKPRNGVPELNQYISYALLVKGPPSFGWKEPNLPPPPDVAAIDDFTPVLQEFYREANIGDLWKQAQPYYDQAIAQYHEPVSRAVLLANSYLRNPTDGYQGRHFQILIDLIGPPNQIQTRHYLDDDIVVVSPAVELPIAEIRHAYLRYLIDPLSFKFASELRKKAAIKDYALASPILEAHYKEDFGLLATECLIRAAEIRLDKKPALVDQYLREGFILTPAFYELLQKYEQQEASMRIYFADLVAGIDLRKEERRLDHVDFLSERQDKVVRVSTTVVQGKPTLTGAAKTLEDAEDLYGLKNYSKAKETFLRAMKETAEKPLHAKAYYGLARIAVLERDPETGDKLFRQVLESDPDAATKSWSLLYLGRLADSQGERDEARGFYQAALAVPGIPEQVRQAAEKGVKEAFGRN